MLLKISSLLPANYSDPGLQPFTGALTPTNSRQVPPPYSNKNSDGNKRNLEKEYKNTKNAGQAAQRKIQRPYNTAV